VRSLGILKGAKMTISKDEKIERCTDDELFEYWLKSDWCMLVPYSVYKEACISNGTEVIEDGKSEEGSIL
jgi:hypothetical protein